MRIENLMLDASIHKNEDARGHLARLRVEEPRLIAYWAEGLRPNALHPAPTNRLLAEIKISS